MNCLCTSSGHVLDNSFVSYQHTGGAVGRNEMGWVEHVNYTKKKAEVEALETTGEKHELWGLLGSWLLLAQPPWRCALCCVSQCTAEAQRRGGAPLQALHLHSSSLCPAAASCLSLPELPFWLLTQQHCSAWGFPTLLCSPDQESPPLTAFFQGP